jgi:organic radical activating enzyme
MNVLELGGRGISSYYLRNITGLEMVQSCLGSAPQNRQGKMITGRLLRLYRQRTKQPDKFPDSTPMVDAWFEGPQRTAVLLRWLFTEWCNYRCPYCPQTHDRFAQKDGGFTAHAFDNHPVEKWIEYLDYHFGDQSLSLVLTGGEPLIDKKNMSVLLKHLTTSNYVKHLRIDTNMSFLPAWYGDIARTKILLMCTFHPSQVSEEKFLRNLDVVLAGNFSIGMINYVMDAAYKDKYLAFRDLMWSRGIPVQPNPLFGSKGEYALPDVEIMKENLPARDFELRSQNESPCGKPCLFPAVAYEMDLAGRIHVGCHPETQKSFFDTTLPLSPTSFSPCPYNECVCLDKYSFLKDFARNTTIDPFKLYSDDLRQLQSKNSRLLRPTR